MVGEVDSINFDIVKALIIKLCRDKESKNKKNFFKFLFPMQLPTKTQ